MLHLNSRFHIDDARVPCQINRCMSISTYFFSFFNHDVQWFTHPKAKIYLVRTLSIHFTLNLQKLELEGWRHETQDDLTQGDLRKVSYISLYPLIRLARLRDVRDVRMCQMPGNGEAIHDARAGISHYHTTSHVHCSFLEPCTVLPRWYLWGRVFHFHCGIYSALAFTRLKCSFEQNIANDIVWNLLALHNWCSAVGRYGRVLQEQIPV